MLGPVMKTLNDKMIVLASSSSRRQEMLAMVGLKCITCSPEFDENLSPSDFASFSEFVEATAVGKVNEVFERLTKQGNAPDLVIGADTMVTLDGKMYGKPGTEDIAIKTLKMLSGKANIVYTGVALKTGSKLVQFTEQTKVFMGELTDEEIKAYVATGEPLDKAGSYGIQGIGSCIIERIEGDYFTVMGLPLYRLSKELTKLML